MEPIGWSYAGVGHCLEELEFCVMEFLWHVFNKNSRDVVGARCFAAREKAESFVENGGGEFAYDHLSGRRRGSWSDVYPRKRAVRVDTGVRREGGG